MRIGEVREDSIKGRGELILEIESDFLFVYIYFWVI